MAKNDSIRAGRNRTLTVSEEEIPALKMMITLPDELSAKSSFVDLLIHADALAVLDTIPDGCADLIIIDPPYNLSKTFHSSTFKARSDAGRGTRTICGPGSKKYVTSWRPGAPYICAGTGSALPPNKK